MAWPMALDLRSSLLAAGLAAVLAAGGSAQSCELPFDLVDVADDPLAPDWCGVDFTWVHAQPSSQVEAAGVSLADFDNDGLLDIFFPNTHPAPHRLYRNLGGFAFEDVAASKGLADVDADAASATFFDYDHDGDLDLFLTSHLGSPALPLGPRFKLFRNMGAAGDFAFIDVTAAAGFVLAPTPKGTLWGWVSGVCAGDYDQAYKFLFIAKGGGSANKTFLFQETKALLNPKSLLAWIDKETRKLGTAACPPYHLVFVIGGTSAEATMKTVPGENSGWNRAVMPVPKISTQSSDHAFSQPKNGRFRSRVSTRSRPTRP